MERAEKAQALNLEEQRLKNLKIGVDKEGNDLSIKKNPRNAQQTTPASGFQTNSYISQTSKTL